MMLATIKKMPRWEMLVLLFGMCVFCVVLSVTRFVVTDTKVFLFLNWNLFLAFIPWLISTIVVTKKLNSKPVLAFLVLSWLLFFPNSPYILTDLFHLRLRTAAPIWFDLVLILSYAWTGLLFGFISLMDIEALLQRHISSWWTSFIGVFFLFLSGFGIYLGRFLRWNSWDILSNPLGLFSDIVERVVDPLAHSRTWGVTILMGVLLNMMYFSFKLMRAKDTKEVY